ncbi:hypothetical protein ACIRSU_27565 [Streptomyces sp. NPDC101160]
MSSVLSAHRTTTTDPLATGYRPLFDVDADPESLGSLPFEKHLENPNP